MSKSKYSKTKAAGMLCGMSRCGNYKFRQAKAETPVFAQNRQMRRAQKKK